MLPSLLVSAELGSVFRGSPASRRLGRRFIDPLVHQDVVIRINMKFSCRSGMYMGSLVPDFPRLLDRPDVLPKQLVPLPGFNVNVETHILLPDMVNISNLYSVFIALSFVVALVNFEVIELLREYQDEKVFEKLAENLQRKPLSEETSEESDDEEAAKERRRGLGWLAVITAIAVWCAGLVNSSPNALQP